MTARSTLAALALAALGWTGNAAHAQALPDDSPRTAFRVCQDPNNMPFSNLAGEGFENRIAELFARDLGLPVTYYSFPNRLAFIRNTLRFKLPDEAYRCDVVMGVPAGFDQVSATKPYYRSTYALVFPRGKGMDAVRSSEDLLALPPERLRTLRIGVYDRSPASMWLARHGLVDRGVPYAMMSPDPEQYPGQIIERELAQGRIDAAIVWGPIASYFARRVKSPELLVAPMKSEPGLPFDFAMAMGVRYGEPKWKKQIEDLIARHRVEILAILREYGVPLVDEATPTAVK
ncbi:substrate-binding domain-containing protein [Ramlibacter alkalitolerans]|jgi:quinoprotein dehydrogenase-associated probable ABC transporter substrate-binding protein|uniref:Substrate-binding domain-containing protein n=1 Tax=Ramlibacter alkalitolerans TaxID=2039631 RepID=A0ABS1JKD1_9BURK|nr:substrate-binding domain-containing protein [Ramlibacter alkalitolerans]MBL0424688.1 substrate-binding domain-containing protein [Ramlibacter alkalitolerans]